VLRTARLTMEFCKRNTCAVQTRYPI
jgi:hypothetical protein